MRHRHNWLLCSLVALALRAVQWLDRSRRPGQATLRRRAPLRGAVGAAVLRRARRGDLRRHPSDRAALQHAPQGGPVRQDGHQAGRGSRGVLDDLQGRAGLHVQAASRREVPRRQRHDVEGREGLLRQDHLPARGREVAAQGRLPLGRGGGGAGRPHRPLPAEVPRVVLPAEPGVALELDLQGRHPGQGHELVREERDGDRPLHLRRARQGLALGGQEEPELLGQGQALPRRVPGDVHELVLLAGGRDPGRAGAHPVPRLQPGRAGSARPGDGQQDHGAGEPLGLPELRLDAPREEALRRQAGAAGPLARARPVRGLPEALQDHDRAGRERSPGARHPVRDPTRGAGEAGRLRAGHQRGARRGQAPAARGGRARRVLVHVQEPRDPASLRAGRASGSWTSGGRSG